MSHPMAVSTAANGSSPSIPVPVKNSLVLPDVSTTPAVGKRRRTPVAVS